MSSSLGFPSSPSLRCHPKGTVTVLLLPELVCAVFAWTESWASHPAWLLLAQGPDLGELGGDRLGERSFRTQEGGIKSPWKTDFGHLD